MNASQKYNDDLLDIMLEQGAQTYREELAVTETEVIT